MGYWGYSFHGPDIFSIFFWIFALVIIALIIFAIISGIAQFSKNEVAPLLTVNAIITAKRIDTSSHMHSVDNSSSHMVDTSYYVTFQVPSGDRMEFLINGREYGQLAEGDRGNLSFKGTRYLGFERIA